MPRQVQIKNGPTITIADKPFASGGEGDLYKITAPKDYTHLVAKIYKPEKQTAERERKIDFLSRNPPGLHEHTNHDPVVWIDRLIYQNGKFAGFTMPFAKGEKLEMLCNPKLPPQLGHDWKKFDFADPKSLELRQKICFNIAVAVNQVHSLQSYVLIDMKPENIMIQANGLVSVIDTDSVEVLQNGSVLFYAPVVTPEYTPPEYYRGIKPESKGAPVSWDGFSLAVICYRLLCGIHPFVGSCHPPFDHCNSYELKIENGLFPNGRNRSKYKVIPREHHNFDKLSDNIRQLFLRCFDEGHSSADLRPSIEDWCRELLPESELQFIKLLPSFTHKFPAYTFSKELTLNSNNTLQPPVFTFPDLPKTSLIGGLFNIFRGASDKEQLRSLINSKKSEFHYALTGMRKFEDQLSALLTATGNEQRAILEQEKKEIDALKADFTTRLAAIDAGVKAYLDTERKQYHALHQATASMIASLNQEMAFLKNRLIDPPVIEFDARRSKHHNTITNIELQRKQDILQRTTDPKKLAQYILAPYAKEIFNSAVPQLIASLHSFGVFTAADFTAVKNNGTVRTGYGSWVKIVGLGATRATMLDNWRRNIDTKEDLLIATAITNKAEADTKEAESLFSQYEACWKNTFEPVRKEYEQKKHSLELQIKECHARYETQKEQLQLKLKDKHDNVINNSAATAADLSADIGNKQRSISRQTQSKLEDSITTYHSALALIKADQAQFEAALRVRYEEIMGLHERFARI